MKRLLEQFNVHGLFIKMFFVMFVSIVVVSITITYSTIRMSEQLFMNTFSITNSKIINQLHRSMDEFSYSVAAAASRVQENGIIKSYLTQDNANSLSTTKLYYNTDLQMEQIYYANIDDYKLSLTITGENGRLFSTNSAYWPATVNELERAEITENTYKKPKQLLYQFIDKGVMNNSEPMIVITKALMERTAASIYGAVYIAIQESDFKQFYIPFTSEGNDMIVLNSAGQIFSSNQSNMVGKTSDELLQYAKEITQDGVEYKNIDFLGKDQLILATYLPRIDMYVVNLIDKELVMDNLINTKTILLISASIVLISLLAFFLISRRLTKSLTLLVKQISMISKNQFDGYVTVSGSSETKELALAFNYMLDELHDYIEELMESQKKQRNAELAALQRQINPHFLYNTLASVKIMVQQGNKEKAAETINALISLLQHAVGNVNETITVKEEIDNLKSYVFINQVRYGNRINVNYFIAPDCLDLHLPKLVIQPFIENAFFHGFTKKQEGTIHIAIQREGEKLVCEVVDNGDGMEIDEHNLLPASRKKKLFSGIGVRNVNDRIKLLYGETYGVYISSEIGVGTHIKITLPVQESKDNPKI
ncbi:membrane protein [Bacillus sp. SA1-12]|uniref:sensor histidine kinase n=1 Tax=Bacillus sp. SA1-12 TaxID=1455638 RepID=UPI00062509E6|nr:sensor histidine kinase [Bacillus sp. SA1-12]KKI93208.1 membrane protein [Bacillus sp. SA1-12]